MGSACTALNQLINQTVDITTPVVSLTTLREIKEEQLLNIHHMFVTLLVLKFETSSEVKEEHS